MNTCSDTQSEAARWQRTRINLAARALGGDVLAASDDFFAEKDNILLPQDPVFLPEKFTAYGKWMDGWESRRRRDSGHDWAIVRLATAGSVEAIEVDTRHFQGNAPGAVQIDYINSTVDPDENSEWKPLSDKLTVQPNFRNLVSFDQPVDATHIRLNIFPDGGVARLRVYGKIQLNTRYQLPNEPVDLAALMNGGLALDCSDSFFSSMQNLILPGRGSDMHDGWETRRRRQGGHDWVLLKLAKRGLIGRIEVDTLHFKGNYPDSCTVEACCAESDSPTEATQWTTILPEQKLKAHRNHCFAPELEKIDQAYTHIRLNIFPDGGVSRLRVIGQPE